MGARCWDMAEIALVAVFSQCFIDWGGSYCTLHGSPLSWFEVSWGQIMSSQK